MQGDAGWMRDNTRGGNDHLVGGDNADNWLIGDSTYMLEGSRGGNDHLVGGADSVNKLSGDGGEMYHDVRGRERQPYRWRQQQKQVVRRR